MKSEILNKEYKTLKGYLSALTRYEKDIRAELESVKDAIKEQHEKRQFPALYLGESALNFQFELRVELIRIKKERKKIIEHDEINKED